MTKSIIEQMQDDARDSSPPKRDQKWAVGRFAIVTMQNGFENSGLITEVDDKGNAMINLTNSGPKVVTYRSVPYSEEVATKVTPLPPNTIWRPVRWRLANP